MFASSHFSWSVSPLVPPEVLLALALAGGLIIAVMAWRQMGGVYLRALAFALLLLALFDPVLVRQERAGLKHIVPVVLDVSASQELDDRRAQMDAAQRALQEQFAGLDQIEPRFIDGASPQRGEDGTHLFASLNEAMSDVAPDRVAGVMMISDGQVHDVPPLSSYGFAAPLHVLVTGHAQERDRRIDIVDAPRFGLVGTSQFFVVRVVDTQPDSQLIDLIVRRDGVEIERRRVPSMQNIRIPVGIEHAGSTMVEFEVPVLDHELTALNNKVMAQLEGVRDKLKVLLVSGEPHAGERMWRNLLTADANVDLVHFTILRPPEKQDGTPINELSLIAFPTAELFGRRINEFDLIVFDRYSNQTILPPQYFENIVRYVRNGGALLMAVGPDYAGVDGLYFSPLGKVAPARPDGSLTQNAFRPQLSDLGGRHPVTRGLEGDDKTRAWGKWFRQINAVLLRGTSVLTGADQRPLLVLSREDKGRVGLLLSDQMWLWARGYDGGGPYLDMLRRTAHWLMKEPALEEEALRAQAQGTTLHIERQSLHDHIDAIDLETPTGSHSTIDLHLAAPGLWRADVAASAPGLYRLHDGSLTALANVGTDHPLEFQNVVSTLEVLRPLAEATGGSVRRLDEGGGVRVPRVVVMNDSSSYGGRDFIGVRRRDVSEVRGVERVPLALGLGGLCALLGVVACWLREGRARPSA